MASVAVAGGVGVEVNVVLELGGSVWDLRSAPAPGNESRTGQQGSLEGIIGNLGMYNCHDSQLQVKQRLQE